MERFTTSKEFLAGWRVLGTNCPMPSGWNWTYTFQVKDRIGSFFYFPSINFQKAAGGYGGIIVNNCDVIPVSFGMPDGYITLFISDWYNRDLSQLALEIQLLGVSILYYSNSQGPALGPLPDGLDELHMFFSMTQARSIRWDVSASGARPNPQGSFHYGDITVTDVHVLLSKSIELINGKSRTTLNVISYIPPTPLNLAQQFNMPGVYKLDFPNRYMNRPPKVNASIINGTYKAFMEIIFQNNGTVVHSYHLDGYAFFVVGMDFGIWTENSRGTYNKWDGVARCTIQVFPGAWTAILVYLDNVGIWNLRSQNLDTWYLGQEVYMSIVNPEVNDKTEFTLPDNAIFCGALESLQNQQSHKFKFSEAPFIYMLSHYVLIGVFTAWGIVIAL